MTANGTFMVNGTERVIVSQMHRSPGVFFEHDKGKTHASGKLLYSARVIPYRGSWVDLEFDPRDILYVRIDRRRKFHATVLLRALGMTSEDLLNYYYRSDTILFDGRKPALLFNPNHLLGAKVSADVRDPKTNELIVKEGKKFTRPVLRQMEAAKIKHVPMAWEEIVGRVASHDIADPQTKEVLVECNHEITQEKLDLIRDKGIHQLDVLFVEESPVGPYLRQTLLQDRIRSPGCDIEIYRRLRPGDPPTVSRPPIFSTTSFSIPIATTYPKSAGSN
jgi:DNA-directed RNA polymerase subunit beta